jgi:large subunit ribosomal protein L9
VNVILLERVNNLGGLGDEVKVRPGYARNFLLPQGKALLANDANRAQFEERRAELERIAAADFANSQARADAINILTLVIERKAGDEGRLFGSVGAQDIVDAVTEKGVAIERSEVRLPDGPIRQTGEYSVDVHVHAEINAALKVMVAPEGGFPEPVAAAEPETTEDDAWSDMASE